MRSVLFRTAKKSGSRLISINNQVRVWERQRGALRMREDTLAMKNSNKSDSRLRSETKWWHKNSDCPLSSRAARGWTMTTLRQIELSCPICGNSFQSQAVVTTNSFGGKRTDFHERAAGTQPLAYLIHMCGECGYSGAERDFTEEAEVSPLSEGARLERARAEVFALAGRPARRNMKPRRKLPSGRASRRGTWRIFFSVQRGAASTKAISKPSDISAGMQRGCSRERCRSYDGVAREERAVLTYLVGELWRRVGDSLRLARLVRACTPMKSSDLESQQWIVAAAEQQRISPREWFG